MSIQRYDITLPQNRTTQNKVNLLYISSSQYEGDWSSTLHTHYFSELFYVVEGKGQFEIEKNRYPVSSDDLVIINPNVLHTEMSLDASPLKYIVIGIEGLELSPLKTPQNITHCIHNMAKDKDMILTYLDLLLKESESKTVGYEIICQNLIEILVILLSRLPDFSTTIVPTTQKNSQLSVSIRRYIDAHYKEDITLDSIAEAIHNSKYHIVHAFTEEYHISPIKYLISKRIQESKALLTTTDYSLTEISRMLGFSSPSYFSQVFKREEKCSPIDYRKENR